MRNEPTVGIVTAIPEEFTAVKALTENVTRQPIPMDRAPYHVGTLPSATTGVRHSVVLALMPRSGNDIAATTCTNLLRSFPSVNVVIMCGIAAGVPNPDRPEVDVALGDIVVATRGIVDYDHVDETDKGLRLRPGIPRPSPYLTNGANLLHAAEFAGQKPWERWLGPQMPPLPHHYRRPGAIGADGQARYRPAMPRVHYGRIGSADRSLRSARFRDALATEHDLRALEMEGKGIGNSAFLNGIEWFVVRGISDYGDSSTTKVWRPYASLAAAAYTRALLAECEPLYPRGGHAQGGHPPPPGRTIHADQAVIYDGFTFHIGDNKMYHGEGSEP